MADNRLFRGGGTSNSRLRSKGIPRPEKTSLKILSEKSKSFGNGINSQQLNELIGSSDFHDFKRQKVFGNAPGIVPRIFTFNISWDLTNVPITAFGPSGYIVGNTQDRPRINTFLSDGTNLNFVSAGYIYQKALNGNPAEFPAIAAPWGDPSFNPPLREKVTQQVVFNDAPSGTFAGIDIFTANWMPTPVTIPNLTGWTKSSTGNPTEDKYQITFDSPGTYTIDIKLEPGDYSPGVAPSVSVDEGGDDSEDPVGDAYLLQANGGDSATINEGDTVRITLSTQNIADGTELPYTITGVSPIDINPPSLTGKFIIGSLSAVDIIATQDSTTEGTEVMNLALDNGRVNIDTTILDTSQSAPATFAISSNKASVIEGESFTVTLNTTNVADGTSVLYDISGIDQSDISENLTGNFIVNSNTASQTFNIINDGSTEGNETLTFTLTDRTDELGSPISLTVNIIDTGNTSLESFEYINSDFGNMFN